MLLYLDFETFSELDLPSVGSHRYAEHPSTEALCCALAVDDEPVRLWTPGDPYTLPDLVAPPGSNYTYVAHNCEFEREVLRRKFGTDVPLDRWVDTAALAARMSLPRKLKEVALFLGLDVSEKAAGEAAIKALSRPRTPTRRNPDRRWTPATRPEAFAALRARCRRDVELTREVLRRLLPLEPRERELWLLTLRVNERGIPVDLGSIPAAQRVLAEDAAPLEAEFRAITGRPVKSYAKVAEALGLPDVRKPTVRKALRDPETPPRARRALSIYQALSKSSVSKLDAMVARAHADGRVRGSYLYCGADKTGRWSASGMQPQNFKRGLAGETDAAFRALASGCVDFAFTGARRPIPDPSLTPTGTIAEMLRGFILGPLYVGDLKQIEARGVAWLAEDEEQLSLFRAREDPYCAMASVIYGEPVTPRDSDKRFMGKQAELGCGYGVGYRTFMTMLDETYDVQITEEFSRRVVDAYRRRHPKIVKLWTRLGQGFQYAVARRVERVRVTRNLWMGVVEVAGERYAYVELPSGRRVYYPRPELASTARGPCVSFFGKDRYSGGWATIKTYGGKLAENATQAACRDVIAEAMLRVDAAGFPIIMTAHDDIVVEPAGRDLKEFKDIMEVPPGWAAGLPIEVDAFEAMRYRK